MRVKVELDGKSLGRGTSGVVERGRQGCTPVAVKFGVEGDEIAILDALKGTWSVWQRCRLQPMLPCRC